MGLPGYQCCAFEKKVAKGRPKKRPTKTTQQLLQIGNFVGQDFTTLNCLYDKKGCLRCELSKNSPGKFGQCRTSNKSHKSLCLMKFSHIWTFKNKKMNQMFFFKSATKLETIVWGRSWAVFLRHHLWFFLILAAASIFPTQLKQKMEPCVEDHPS